jgi:hypothetical protein
MRHDPPTPPKLLNRLSTPGTSTPGLPNPTGLSGSSPNEKATPLRALSSAVERRPDAGLSAPANLSAVSAPARAANQLEAKTTTLAPAAFAKTSAAGLTAVSAALPGPVVPGAPAVVSPPTRLVLTVLGAFGYNPYQAPAPGSPVSPLQPLLQLAWTAWQSADRRIFNVNPTLTPTVNESDLESGVITGNLGGYDGNNDPLTYTASTPAHGQLDIQPDGSFTYTPDPAYAHQGGPDSFEVTVSDGGGNLHLLSPTPPPTPKTVSLTVRPSNPRRRPRSPARCTMLTTPPPSTSRWTTATETA